MIQPNFFIFGCPRSGTTLLCALLSEHPEVFCLNDSFIFDTYALLKGHKIYCNIWKQVVLFKIKPLPNKEYLVTPDEAKKYLTELRKRYNQPRPGKNKPTWLKHYSDTLDPSKILSKAYEEELTLHNLINITYSQLLPTNEYGKKMFGEKTPRHHHLFHWIQSLYPEAKIIILVRNPISNIAAIYKRNKRDLDKSINLYLSHYSFRVKSLYQEEKNLVIRYEDIINDLEDSLTKIYKHLNVNLKMVSCEFNYFIKQSYIGKKIDPTRDLKSRKILDENQKKIIIQKCRHIFQKFYPEQL